MSTQIIVLSKSDEVEKHEVGGVVIDCMDARKLHAALGVTQRFRDWFPCRVEQHEFVEGVDYEILTLEFQRSPNNRPVRDYVVTLSTARQLSVAELTPQGKVVRLYVLECERRIREAASACEPRLQTTAFTVAPAPTDIIDLHRRKLTAEFQSRPTHQRGPREQPHPLRRFHNSAWLPMSTHPDRFDRGLVLTPQRRS